MDKKIKVLWWSDSPTCTTGFGTVALNLLRELQKTDLFVFHVLGINHDGSPYNREKFPYDIHPAASALNPRYGDFLGRNKLLDMLSQGTIDVLFILQDLFNVLPIIEPIMKIREKLPVEKRFTIIHYFPIDAPPPREWVEKVVQKVDFPVAYTYYGQEECRKALPDMKPLPVIYHGVNTKEFFPVPREDVLTFMRDNLKGIPDFEKHWVLLNVNRNSIRKDFLRTFAAFKILKKEIPEALLICLTRMEDVGGDLGKVAAHFGLEVGKDWFAPTNYSASHGYPVEVLNMIYNSANVVLSTSNGEGWGLSSVEAMACRVPVVFPGHTSLREIIGEDQSRGLLVPIDPKELRDIVFFGAQDNNLIRPAVNPFAMAEALLSLRRDPLATEARAEAAYSWVQQHTWENKAKEWVKVFQQAFERKQSWQQK